MASGKFYPEYRHTIPGKYHQYGSDKILICVVKVAAVDDTKSNAEVNALKALALDHLGGIASKVRVSSNSVEDVKDSLRFSGLEEVSCHIYLVPTSCSLLGISIWRCE